MKRICLLLAILLTATSVFAQNVQVKGTVTDASTGEVISFASLQVQGTMIGTTSDAEGKYTISCPANATLIFSFVGYKTQSIPVNNRGVVDCKLELDSEALDDVLVVAYGSAKKESFTGSAQVIKSEQIEKRTVANLTKALDGMAAGVITTSGSGQPGAGAKVIIRGFGSINASTDPLYVVDGIPFDGAINTLNPNDIESMTVIKDASASALYGSRAANGVVIVTTKRGSENSLDINLKAVVGVSSRAIPRYETLNPYQWTEEFYGMVYRDNIASGMTPAQAGPAAVAEMASSTGIFGVKEEYNPFTTSADQLFDYSTGKIKNGVGLKWSDDWLDECTARNPIREEYQMTVTGGNSRSKYMFSLGYLDEEGLVKYTSFDRYSGRANVESQLKSWLKTGLNMSLSHTDSNMTSSDESSESNTYYSNIFYTCQGMGPIYPMYIRNDKYDIVRDEYGNPSFDWGLNRPSGASAGWNPLANLRIDKNVFATDNASGRTFIDLGGLKTGALAGLKFSINFGFDYRLQKKHEYNNPDFGDGESFHGLATITDRRTFSYTFNQLLTYDRNFGQHHVEALVGHEAYSYNYQYLYGSKSGFPFAGLYELAPATTIQGTSSYQDNYRVESYLSRLNYDFADKYYFSASLRRDGSSRFYRDTRWGNFWSVGASWRISQEDFFSGIDWVNNLTLKASYGVTGNDDLDSYYAWQSLYDLSYANGANSGAVQSSLECKDLKWEKNKNLNLGIEARLFGRLSASIEYYNRYTQDMLMEYPMAVSTGFSGYNKNIGNMRNSGLEISLTTDIIKKDDLYWGMTWMGSTVSNKVLHLADKPEIVRGNLIIKEGETLNSFYYAESAGVDPATGSKLYWCWEEDEEGNKTRYITDDYQEASNCRRICGSRLPDLFGSWSNEVRYKNFDFSLMTTYSIGGKIYDYVYSGLLYSHYDGEAGHVDRLKAWKQPGDITNIPRIDRDGVYEIETTDDELFSASYFAIKNVTVGYTLPAKLLKAINFDSIRVFATADNIKMFSALKGLDPQYDMVGSTGYSYTPARTISLGIDLNF